jgi:hypothetical protein
LKTTRQHHDAITRFLDRLKHRARWLLLGAALARGVTASAVVCLGAGLALSYGVRLVAVAATMASVGLLLVAMGAAWPLRGRWRQSQSTRHQARQVEARLPGLRGRLVTVIDRVDAPGVCAQALLAKAADHAVRATALVTPADVISSRPLKRLSALCGVVLLSVGLYGQRLPVGPLDALAVLLGGSSAAYRLADASVEEAAPALVGDITLRYVFPAYTGLEPREVPNSDGTIIAPPGTTVQIQAKTATAFQAAAVQVNAREPVDAQLVDGRSLSASVTIEQSGTWKFLLFEDKAVTASKAYELRVEADAPPVVVMSETGQSVVPVDAPLGISWNVTDDYGIVRVSVELDRADDTAEYIRREPIDAALELYGVERATPRELGLAPGDTVTLRVVAVDNDRLSGGNRGESEPLVLEVLGPRGYGKNLTRYHEKLRDVLLDALADFLEEPVPPAESREAMIAWAAAAPARLDPVKAVIEEQWGSYGSSGLDGELTRDVFEASARLFRFTLTTFDRPVGASGRQLVRSDLDTFAELHEGAVVTLETAAFVIDSMLREVGVAELARQAKTVAQTAEGLSAQAQEADDPDALLAALDRLARQLAQLQKTAAQLSDDALSAFANSSLEQASGLMDEVRSAIARGEMETAKAMLETLADQLAQFAESLDERQQRAEEQDSELGERFKALMEDLESLAEDQEMLATELAQAQEALGSDFAERMGLWAQLDPLSVAFKASGQAALSGVGDGRAWPSYIIRQITDLSGLASGSRDSVMARDVDGATRRILEVGHDLPYVQRFVDRLSNRSAPPAGHADVDAQLKKMSELQVEMMTILDALQTSPADSSPELADATRALSDRQAILSEAQRELSAEVEVIENALPVASGEAGKSMKLAGEQMSRAQGAVEMGLAMPAEGHQRRAVDKVRETQEHLQQAMEKQSQMQQSMAQMRGERGGQGGERTGETHAGGEPDIPAPELFQTAEAYREALLEGMAGDVPKEFETLKRRFYEDLVRQ